MKQTFGKLLSKVNFAIRQGSRRWPRIKGHGCGLGSLGARYIGPNRGTPGRSVVSAVSAQGSSGPTGKLLSKVNFAIRQGSRRWPRIKGHGCGLGSLGARYIGPNRGTPGRSVVSAVSAQGSSGPTGAGLEESDSAAQPKSLRPEEPTSPAQSESRKSEETDIAEQSETLRSKEAPVIPP